MKKRTAIELTLIMSGKFDLPTKLTVHGTDEYGRPIKETIPEIDGPALDREVDRLLAL